MKKLVLVMCAAVICLVMTGCLDKSDEQQANGKSSGQKISAKSVEQRIIGTWVDAADNKQVIFNADGTGSGSIEGEKIVNYAIVSDKIAVIIKSNYDERLTRICDYRFSNDGKILILDGDLSCLLHKKKEN
ncbi:MAG: hypothetical protein LBH98_09710 [Chitinispirillales bacterium]|jgi:hypothetical protein|nr:hypothetical protein [Chitinispirillales bacterium]